MAKAILPAGYETRNSDAPLEIELREPWLAAILAWLAPGLGHIYQGRTAKGLLFFVCIVGTFMFGLWIGGGKVVYASSPGDQPWRWQYYCQLGAGLPALPAWMQKGRPEGKPHPILGDFMAPPRAAPTPLEDDSGNVTRQPNELAAWMIDRHPLYEVGTVYTVIAGLLNLLVICDAYGGPLVLQAREKKPPGDAEIDEASPDPTE